MKFASAQKIGTLEQFLRSVKRFSALKNCGKNKKLEWLDEPSETKTALVIACFLLLALPYAALAQDYSGDRGAGEQVFRRCIACHYADQERNKVGPSLKNLVGSTAGSREGYRFSPAMVRAGENGLVWTRETLIDYLRNPQAMVRGTRMAAVRLTNEQDIDDLIAYIMAVSKETDEGGVEKTGDEKL